jgi:hypothetical protein
MIPESEGSCKGRLEAWITLQTLAASSSETRPRSSASWLTLRRDLNRNSVDRDAHFRRDRLECFLTAAAHEAVGERARKVDHSPRIAKSDMNVIREIGVEAADARLAGKPADQPGIGERVQRVVDRGETEIAFIGENDLIQLIGRRMRFALAQRLIHRHSLPGAAQAVVIKNVLDRARGVLGQWSFLIGALGLCRIRHHFDPMVGAIRAKGKRRLGTVYDHPTSTGTAIIGEAAPGGER